MGSLPLPPTQPNLSPLCAQRVVVNAGDGMEYMASWDALLIYPTPYRTAPLSFPAADLKARLPWPESRGILRERNVILKKSFLKGMRLKKCTSVIGRMPPTPDASP